MPKEPTQPQIPHPSLETGVAQYPTPLVPNYQDKKGGWSISDQGHIILQEKISLKKGNFNPLPTDGSVTYSGRDAAKWPSPLYLVAERPTEDGLFCIRFWANARSTSSQNPWNYNISYSSENPNFPIYSRTYIVRRVDYASVPLGSADPLNAAAKVTKQEMAELPEGDPLRSLFVAVKVVYETLPGPTLEGDINKEGLMGTIVTKAEVVAAGSPPDALSLSTAPMFSTINCVANTATTVFGSAPQWRIAKGPGTSSGTITFNYAGGDTADKFVFSYTNATTVAQIATWLNNTNSQLASLGFSETQTFTSILSNGDGTYTAVGSNDIISPDRNIANCYDWTTGSPVSGFYYACKSTMVASNNTFVITKIVDSPAYTLCAIGGVRQDGCNLSPSGATMTITQGAVVHNYVITDDLGSQTNTDFTPNMTATNVASGIVTDLLTIGFTGITSSGPVVTLPNCAISNLITTSGLTISNNIGGTILESVVTPVDSTKSEKKTTYTNGPYELDGYSLNAYGAFETTAKSIVAPTTSPDGTGLVVKDVITPIDLTKSQRERTVMQSHPPTVTLYEITKDRAVVQNVTQYLLRSELTTPVIANNIVDVSDTDIGFPWVRRTTKQLPLDGSGNVILPPSRTEFKTITYTFPGIIYTWKASQTNDQARANLSFFNNRYPISMTVAAKHVITYHVTEPDISTLQFFKVVTRPWAKIFFGIPDNTVHPPAPVNLSKQSVKKGNVAFDISGGQASNPSSYIPGQVILIGGDVDQWYGDIFVQTLIYVQEPPGSL